MIIRENAGGRSHVDISTPKSSNSATNLKNPENERRDWPFATASSHRAIKPASERRTIMSFFSWLRKRTSTRSTRWDGLPTRPTTRRFRPRLEALEDRWMPSTLTVTNNLDSGPGSLRADIAAAQSGDTIVFAPSLNGQTITLTSGVLAISKNLTIQGPGASLLTISGNHLSQVFHVTGAQPVVLSGLTISNGLGGISNSGTLTVSQCTLSGNGGLNIAFGGISNGGALTVSQSTLSGNSGSNGGGICNFGALTVNQSTLNGNSARFHGGGIFNFGQNSLLHPAYATLTNCTLSGNSAAAAGVGGGGGLFLAEGTTTLTNCTISRNRCYNNIVGGGIGVDSSGTYLCALNLTNTIVAGNAYGGIGSDIAYGAAVTTMNYCLIGGQPVNVWSGVGNIFIGFNDPGLGLLQNNGGPTQTMALLSGSLAIGNGNNALAPATDQRGVLRLDVAGELTDIGHLSCDPFGQATKAARESLAGKTSGTGCELEDNGATVLGLGPVPCISTTSSRHVLALRLRGCYPQTHERSHAYPVCHRTRGHACRRAAPAVGL
jgi:hypothetical protein